MNQGDDMNKTTMTIEVDEATKKRLGTVAERSDQSVEQVLSRVIEEGLTADEAWQQEIQRRLDVPREQQKFVSNEEVGKWVRSLGTDNPLSRPEGKTLN